MSQTVKKYFKYDRPAEGYRYITQLTSIGDGSWIDTEFIPNSNTKIDCQMAWYDLVTDNFAFGGGITWNDRNIELYSYGSAFETHYSGNAIHGSYTSGSYFHFIQDKGSISIYNEDGTLNTSTDFGTKTFDCVYPLAIFALHRANMLTCAYKQSVKTFKLYDNGTLVRDFRPAERESDNVLGLYDLVNKKFYTNAGAGTFDGGAII